MAAPTAITIRLDRVREVRLDQRARIRLDSLDPAPRRPGIYQLSAILWAMLVDSADLPDPASLGPWLETPEQVKAAGEAIAAATKQAADSEKNGHGSRPKHGPASS